MSRGVGSVSALRRGTTAAVGNAALFTVALAGWGAFPVVGAHAALAYPGGHLLTRRARIAVMVGYLTLVGLLGILSALMFDPAADGCRACPDNLLSLGSRPALADALHRAGLVGGALAVLLLAAECTAEFLASSPAGRGQIGVVLGAAVIKMLATAMLLLRSVPLAVVPLDVTTRVLLAVQGLSLCGLALGDMAERVRLRRARSRMAGYALEIGRSAGAQGHEAGAGRRTRRPLAGTVLSARRRSAGRFRR